MATEFGFPALFSTSVECKAHPLGGLLAGGHASPVGRRSESHAITVTPISTTSTSIQPPTLLPPRDEKPGIHLILWSKHVGFLTPCQCQGIPCFPRFSTTSGFHDQTTVRNTDLHLRDLPAVWEFVAGKPPDEDCRSMARLLTGWRS